MSGAIAKLKYAYEHSQMISSPEMREELGRQFDKLIAEVQAEAWDECADVAGDIKGQFGELHSLELRRINPHRENE